MGFRPSPGSRRPHWIRSASAAVVVSGNQGRDIDELCAGVRETEVMAASSALYRELVADEAQIAASEPMHAALGLSGGGRVPELLVVGRDRVVGRINPSAREWIPAGSCAFLPIGAWRWHFLEPLGLLDRQVPATMAGCLARATSWARSYCDAVYGGGTLEEMLRDNLTPTVGYPLRVVLFDASGCRQFDIEGVAMAMAAA